MAQDMIHASESPAGHKTALAHRHLFGALLFAALLSVPLVFTSSFELAQFGTAIAYVIAAIGLNIALGYGGQLVLCHPLIMAVAAYGAAIASAVFGLSFMISAAIGIVAGTLAGVAVMATGLRVQGWYFALTTLFGVLVLKPVVDLFEPWTGGDFGLTGIARPVIMSFQLSSWMVYELAVITLALVWFCAANLASSTWGIRFRLLRDAPRAAETMGLNLQNVKLSVYLLSALPAALSGVLLAFIGQFVNADSFGINLALMLLTGVILGGAGTIWGPLIGMAPLLFLSFWIGPFSPYNPIAFGLGLLFAALLFPNGINHLYESIMKTRRGGAPASRPPAAAAPRAANPSRGSASRMVDDNREVLARIDKVSKHFGGVQALNDVSFDIARGRVTGLVGPNGSGKSTLLNILSGFIRRDGGALVIEGKDMGGLPAYLVARGGIGRSFQVPQLVGELTTVENIGSGLVGSQAEGLLAALLRSPQSVRREAERREKAHAAFHQLGLPPEIADQPASDLPLGLKRIVEIGRAMVASPTLLLLDEPTAGLNDEERATLGRVLRDLGITILVIEHNVPFVLEFCDEVALLEVGSLSGRGSLGGELPGRRREYLGLALAEIPGKTG